MSAPETNAPAPVRADPVPAKPANKAANGASGGKGGSNSAAPGATPDPSRVVHGWTPRPSCRVRSISGGHVSVVPFDAGLHARQLWEALGGAKAAERIRYFGWGPIATADELAAKIDAHASQEGWSTAAFLSGGRVVGMASYMREDAASGSVEIGAIAHGEVIARTPAATEAQWLLMRHAFELGYRRYEWKCDAANAASVSAAQRLGFTHEGTFRQHMVRGGRNRDTAWFSILDTEWPRVDAALRAWLNPSNFAPDGSQRRSLSTIRASA